MDTLFDHLFHLLGENKLLYHTVLGGLIGVTVMAAGKIMKFFLNTVGRTLIKKTNNDLDDKILEIIIGRIIAISGVSGLYLGIKELQQGLGSSHTGLLTVIEYSHHILYIAAALILTSVVTRLAKTLITHALKNAADKNELINTSITPLVNRVAAFVVFLFAIIVVLDHFGQNITSVVTLLGAGSLALGLAAQDTISNMISGFIIMLDRPFRIGDRIKIPTGEVGDIFEIGLRSTKILDFDNNLIIVPNNELIKTRVVNYGYPAGEIGVTVDVGVAYGTNVEQVKKLLINIAANHPIVLKTPPPDAFLMSLDDWALQFRLVCRVASFRDQFLTAEQLRVKAYEELMRSGIEIPFPQQIVHYKPVHGTDALQITSKRKKISRQNRRSDR